MARTVTHSDREGKETIRVEESDVATSQELPGDARRLMDNSGSSAQETAQFPEMLLFQALSYENQLPRKQAKRGCRNGHRTGNQTIRCKYLLSNKYTGSTLQTLGL